MQVPIAQQTVGLTTPQAQTPTISTPIDMGQVAVQRGNEAMFAGAEKLATVVAQHLEKQKVWREQEQAYDASEKFRKEMTDKMYSQEVVGKKIPAVMGTGADGKPYILKPEQVVDMPAGYLNRRGFLADGMSQQLQADLEATKAKYMPGLSPYAQRLYLRTADTHAASFYDTGVRHQANQVHEAGVQTRLDTEDGIVNTGFLSSSPDELLRHVTNIHQMNSENQLFDPTHFNDQKRDRLVEKMVQGAAFNTLDKTGSVDNAKQMVDAVSAMLPPKSALEINDLIDKRYLALQTRGVRLKKESQIGTALTFADDIISGKRDITKISTADIDELDMPEEFKGAIKTAISSKGLKTANGPDVKGLGMFVKGQDKIFATQVAAALSSDDKEKSLKVLNDALHNFGKGNISQERFNIVARLILQRTKSLPGVKDDNSIDTSEPKQKEFDSGLMSILEMSKKTGMDAVNMVRDYMQNSANGKPAAEAYESAVRSQAIRLSPALATTDGIPKVPVIIDRNDPTRYFILKTDKPSQYVHDKATGMIVPNGKYKNQRQEQK